MTAADVWQQLEREVKAARGRVRADIREAASWGMDFPTREPTGNVRELLALRRLVDDLIADETIRARELGAGWSSLGTSRQQAQQRHKRAMARRNGSIGVDEIRARRAD